MRTFRIFSATFLFLVIACNNHSDGKAGDTIDSSSEVDINADRSNTWISSFAGFREALQNEDRQKVKSFFDFPVTGELNEIWFVADPEMESTGTEEKVIPFTEKDFDKYYLKLFPEMFVRSIQGVNADSLFLNGEYDTVEYKEGATTFTLHSSFDKAENTIYLNLATKTPIPTEEADGLEFSEFNMIYQFVVDKNGRMKFKQINLAG